MDESSQTLNEISQRNPTRSASWASSDRGDPPITQLFYEAMGDRDRADELYRLLQDHFRSLVRTSKRRMQVGDSLPTDDPIGLAFVETLKQESKDWKNREHILGALAIAMKNEVCEHVRRKATVKRGGKKQTVRLGGSDVVDGKSDRAAQLIEAGDLLDRLIEDMPVPGAILFMKHYGPFTYDEIAQLFRLTHSQVETAYHQAMEWLLRQSKRDG